MVLIALTTRFHLTVILLMLIAFPGVSQSQDADLPKTTELLDPYKERTPSDRTIESIISTTPTKDPERFLIDDPDIEEMEDVQPASRILPIWGDEAREKGYELPLPFGVGANFVLQQQVPKLNDLSVGIGNLELQPDVSLDDSEINSLVSILRLDAWVFPFFNLYVFGGPVAGKADIVADVPAGNIAGLPTAPFSININNTYTGINRGIGGVLAGGYKQFFGTLDMNYSRSDLDFLKGMIEATTITPRVGMLVKSERYGNGNVWIGLMHMKLKERLSGSVTVPSLGPGPDREMSYDLTFTTKDPNTYLIGGMWEFSRKFQAQVEVGYGGRTSLMGGVAYRF